MANRATAIVTNNPNATTATVSGSIAVCLIYVQGVAGLDVPAEVAAAEATLIIAAVLFVGRFLPKRS